MSYYEATATTDRDLWHVQLASGEVCTMTLDLLDDAFQDGIINEQTFVWQEGSPDWVTLGEVAGLDAVDSDAAVLMSSQGDSPWPSTIIAPTYPATSMAPHALANPYSLTPYSTAPVAGDISDIDFELDSVSFRPRKRSKLRWVVAAAFLGAIGFAGVKRNELAERYRVYLPPSVIARLAPFAASLRVVPTPPPQVQVAAPAPPPVVTAPPVAAQPAPVPASSAATADTRFSEDQKKALLGADKTRTEKQKQKQKTRVAAPSSNKPRVKSENPFHKGGEQGDPLNASL